MQNLIDTSAFKEASRLEQQARILHDQIAELRHDKSFDFDRFYRLEKAAWFRYRRRVDARQAAFEAYLNDFDKYQTQQIASAVEREAFPPAPVFVHESEYSFNDEYNQVIDYDDELENSGDTFAAPPAGAPVLSATTLGAFEHVNVKSLQKGQGSTFEQRAEQGSGSLPYYFRRIPGVRFWWYAKPVSRLRDAYPGKTLKLTVYANWARGVRHV